MEAVICKDLHSYLVTTAVFSVFFTLTFSLTGTLFRIVDVVLSCRMGPIATNPLELMLPINVPFKPVNTSCSLHCRMSRRYNLYTPGNGKQKQQQVIKGRNSENSSKMYLLATT